MKGRKRANRTSRRRKEGKINTKEKGKENEEKEINKRNVKEEEEEKGRLVETGKQPCLKEEKKCEQKEKEMGN
jgi:hypothetical protein